MGMRSTLSGPGVGVFAAALAFGGPALADDSTAGLANGGLVFTKSTTIEMRWEKLALSDKAVRVQYAFVNTSPKAVSVTMAFPFPDVTVDGPDDSQSIPKDANNFLGFKTTVDGKAVQAQLLQKVVKNGVDRTALLKSLGVPLAPFLGSTIAALGRLPKAQQEQLVKLGLAMPFEYDVGKGPINELLATWTVETRYYWTQTFPAGQVVTIEHDYTPSVGSSAVSAWGSSDMATSAAARTQYCIDNTFVAAARKGVGAADAHLYGEERIAYVLVTGANWKGPIGDFQMTIDKGAAANLVSFCGTGVTKAGPTSFQVRYKNFTPKANVNVLLLIRRQAGGLGRAG